MPLQQYQDSRSRYQGARYEKVLLSLVIGCGQSGGRTSSCFTHLKRRDNTLRQLPLLYAEWPYRPWSSNHISVL